ncbi:MAG: sugar ABC transporter permease [Chloroflexota bacterium]|nr:sugar ABC transporter permease [Chloroflexota bacterium]
MAAVSTPSDSPAPPVRPRFGRLSDRALVWTFLTPTMLLLLGIAVFPLLWSLYLSFTKFSVINDANTGPTWIGTKNFERLLNDPDVWLRFTTTARFVIPAVAIELLLGFGLALLLNRKFGGRGLLMTLMLIPMMLSPLIVALFWNYMYQPSTGIIDYWLQVFGLPQILWTTDLNTAMWSLVIVDVWQWTPFIMLIALAGLSAVPKYLYEAAEVDRASGWFKFRQITLPLVTPLLLIAILFRLMDSYRMFDQAYALNISGNVNQVLSVYLYQMAFRDFNTGKGSALGYIMLVVIIALANLLIRVLNGLKAEQV